MGFETNDRRWRIDVSDTQAYRQFGNAVVVQVVEFVAQALRPHIVAAVSATEAKYREPDLGGKDGRMIAHG
jgi:DNA (cytosine-5)-methyltransferase 1